MKKEIKIHFIINLSSKCLAAFLIVCMLFLFPACARQPEAKRSSKIIQSYFKKYAKKYPTSIYGTSGGVKEVEIMNQKEIHKHLVAVQAFLTLKDGSVERINATVERGPTGWRFVSWENDTNL